MPEVVFIRDLPCYEKEHGKKDAESIKNRKIDLSCFPKGNVFKTQKADVTADAKANFSPRIFRAHLSLSFSATSLLWPQWAARAHQISSAAVAGGATPRRQTTACRHQSPKSL